MKQTAVEWQFEQFFNSFEKFNNGECTFNDYLKRNLEIRKQAKEMEKEHQRQILIGLLDWMNKVAQDNPMVFETDSEDIVDMYLEGYYTKEK